MNESILDGAQTERVMREMRAFTRQVNAAFIAPGFIANVRKKLDLDQREAAGIFGGGVIAFSRCETGKTKPPLALIKLLKVPERHPELIHEVDPSNLTVVESMALTLLCSTGPHRLKAVPDLS